MWRCWKPLPLTGPGVRTFRSLPFFYQRLPIIVHRHITLGLEKYIREIETCLGLDWLARAKAELSREDYDALTDEINRRQQLGDLERQMDEALEKLQKCFQTDFCGADDLYRNQFAEFFSRDDYEKAKRTFVQNWFEQNPIYLGAIQPNDEQIAAISSINENVLLKARAGSGKTSVVVERTRFLIQHAGVKPDEIMLLAFNTKAALEITQRIQQQCSIQSFNNARTFHGLAWQLVKPDGDILFDKKTGGKSPKEQTKFIQKLFDNESVYDLFRSETTKLQDIGAFLSKNDYHACQHGHSYVTLKGTVVKSLGEKFIGDFLFEHNITYAYEKVWILNNRNYRPGFSLGSKKPYIVIEHWEIDENDSKKPAPVFWNGSWDEYKAEINRKRKFWNLDKYARENAVFLETSIADLRHGRAHFEKILHGKLADVGVELEKLDHDELIEKIEATHIATLSAKLQNFIQRAKYQRLLPGDLVGHVDKLGDNENRILAFLRMANEIYHDYARELKKTNLLDYNDLLEQAIDEVQRTEGNCAIHITNGRSIKIKNIRYLMIDEYQDFSPLFFYLVDAIRKCNLTMKVFCVGDDWQAINAFAGSDLKYFVEFDRYIDDAKKLLLRANYRCAQKIVDVSNLFMRDKGEPSRAEKSAVGEIYKCHTDKIYLEQRNTYPYKKAHEFDARFVAEIKDKDGNIKYLDNKLVMARTLKACHAIITDEKNRNKQFAIMNRKNRMDSHYDSLNKFKRALKKTCKDHPVYRKFDNMVKVDTTHSFKGREADVVIMLSVNYGAYPLIHSDNELYTILGVTSQKILDEERRLFYVGLTRAKEKLYLLCESETESNFLREIDNNPGLAEYKVHKHPPDDDDDFDDEIPF